jgi:BirA family biotin operon repressor/biotin-[acetyl-CoA-carboxylase] ligase
MSVLCRPDGEVAREVLSLRVGLAVARAIETAGAVPALGLKWPNDLILRDRKVGGILCEARWRGDRLGWVADGIGINVRNPIPGEVAATAARLADADPTLTPEGLAQPVADAIVRAAHGAGPLDAGELAEFARRDWLRGRRLEAPLAGTAGGIGPDGSLIVLRADGTPAAFRAGTVVLAAEPKP